MQSNRPQQPTQRIDTLASVEAPSSIQRIEPFPGSALALLKLVPPQSGDVQELGALFQQEPLLLAAVGKVAIASGEYIAGDVPDFRNMLERMGSADLLKIAITLSVRGYLQRAFNVFEDRRYWLYTLACAVSCAEIAAPGESTKLVAYVAGLLHDIGRLALIAAYPDKYANLLTLADRMFQEDPGFNLLDHERMLFGLDHFATGSWLATTWGLPPWLRAITGKFNEALSGEHRELVATVRCGTGLAHSLGFGYLQAAPRAEVREILRRLPAAWARWQNLDHWKHGAEHVQAKIQSQLNLYAMRMPENE